MLRSSGGCLGARRRRHNKQKHCKLDKLWKLARWSGTFPISASPQ